MTPTSIVFNTPYVQAGTYKVRARLDPIGETNSYAINIQSSLALNSIQGSVMGG